jgi:hypothetical protein
METAMQQTVTKLSKGDRVNVYDDPYTRHKLEGVATCVGNCSSGTESDGFEYWNVDFRDGHGTTRRTIHPADKIG